MSTSSFCLGQHLQSPFKAASKGSADEVPVGSPP